MNEVEKLDLDNEIPEMKIVPSRWEKSGFKYVFEDPAQKKYFNSPQRRNGAFGGMNEDANPRRSSFDKEIIASGFQNSITGSHLRRGSEIGSTYAEAFRPAR